MEAPILLLYPPVLLIGQPAPGAWPPDENQKEVRFLSLGILMHLMLPHPQTGQQTAMIQITGLGDWPLRNESWASAKLADVGEAKAYWDWRAAMSGIAMAGGNDPLAKNPDPEAVRRTLRRIK